MELSKVLWPYTVPHFLHTRNSVVCGIIPDLSLRAARRSLTLLTPSSVFVRIKPFGFVRCCS
jgi:hypothetical protein